MGFSGVFAIGLSGINAFSTGLEAVSNNIANSQTDGYKRARTDFADLLPADAPEAAGSISTGLRGAGVSAENRQLLNEQGAVTRTNEATNIAVLGDGFFVVSETADANAATSPFLFTRAGGFSADATGNLVNDSGYYLRGSTIGADGAASTIGGLGGLDTVNINRAPAIADPASLGALTGVEIDADGIVIGSYANGQTQALFQIPLALFVNAEGLEQAEATAFRNTTESGELTLVGAGEGRAGSIEGAAVENSTVDIGREFSTLIETQRAYSSNARVISVADELWRTLVQTAA